MQSLQIPNKFRKIVVNKLSTDFRGATEIQWVQPPQLIRPTEVIVQNSFVGINASDINFTAGVYKPGVKPPFDCGFEAIGTVVAVGEKVTGVELNNLVITQHFGAFSEYQVVPSRNLHKVPALDPRFLPLEISGTTALLALEHVGKPVEGETALVTAAAGATGLFAAQLLKHVYGCKVVCTCSSGPKADLLHSLGMDRVIDYKREDLNEVLAKEFKTGINLVYESVGGPTFDTCINNLSVKGRVVTIGSITGYQSGESWKEDPTTTKSKPRVPLNTTLLQKSASLRGFFLPHFAKYHREAFDRLVVLVGEGKIQSIIDPKQFKGIDSVPAAVEYLHSGANIGKVVASVKDVESQR